MEISGRASAAYQRSRAGNDEGVHKANGALLLDFTESGVTDFNLSGRERPALSRAFLQVYEQQ
jgi:hypothetical protein